MESQLFQRSILQNNIQECIPNISNANAMARKCASLDLKLELAPIEFVKTQTIAISLPRTGKNNVPLKSRLACFDLDWTLTYNTAHLYPKDPNDIFILPKRIKILRMLLVMGYSIVIFTNQYAVSVAEQAKRIERVSNALKKLALPAFAFIALGKDGFRKPEIGMWNELQKVAKSRGVNIDLAHSFYCGDALGRSNMGDFSDSDLKFAQNCGLAVCAPEELFIDNETLVLERERFAKIKHPMAVIFVGVAGSGKSTLFKKSFGANQQFFLIEQDDLKTRAKVIKVLNSAIASNDSIVIDSTNASFEKRKEYYDLIPANYNIVIVHLVRNGYAWNQTRENKVPTIAYHIYHKQFNDPALDGELIGRNIQYFQLADHDVL